ncbi:hypothetical protein AVEN_16767-1 [Araneus ventricosus]|uniref:Uncharacterized protein n=1 Tax=Araneus ventricosus TaxID=182803 RepID=A0A4Y2BSU0_ARAVE|nr:hypothetical protein AVEN_16767-1 [Araneus ventricosus]
MKHFNKPDFPLYLEESDVLSHKESDTEKKGRKISAEEPSSSESDTLSNKESDKEKNGRNISAEEPSFASKDQNRYVMNRMMICNDAWIIYSVKEMLNTRAGHSLCSTDVIHLEDPEANLQLLSPGASFCYVVLPVQVAQTSK